MRRIGQWMLNALTTLSLLLCVGTSVLWERSYRVRDSYSRHVVTATSRVRGTYRNWQVMWSGGRVFWRISIEDISVPDLQDGGIQPRDWSRSGHNPADGSPAEIDMEFHRGLSKYNLTTFVHGLGLKIERAHDPPSAGGKRMMLWLFVVPFWMLAGLFGVLPLIRGFVALRRRRRTSRGFCPCGYDLTANVSGVCPECGTKIAEAK